MSQPADLIPPVSPTGTPPAAPPAGEPPPAAKPAAPDGKVITMPTSAVSRIKEEARQKAAAQTKREYDRRAQALGYKDFEDMERKFQAPGQRQPQRPQNNQPQRPQNNQQSRQQNNQPPAGAPPAGGEPPANASQYPRYTKKLERENARLLEQTRRANRARAHEERQRIRLEKQLDAQQAETQLRIAAMRAGVQDVDYAIFQLRAKIAGQTSEQLEKFDETKYFAEELRQSHPYLYGVETKPAHTGPPTDTKTQNPPAPGGKPPEAPGGAKPDALKMSKEQYEERMRKMGLSPPGAGLPA